MFLFETYRGFDMCGIDVRLEFHKVRASFLKHHSTSDD